MEPTKAYDHTVILNFQHQLSDNWKLTAQGSYSNYARTGTSLWAYNIEENGNMDRYVTNADVLNEMKFGQIYLNGKAQTGKVSHKIMTGLDMNNKHAWYDWSQSYALDSTGTFNVLAEAVKEINGKPIDMNDVWPDFTVPKAIEISVDEINGLLGTRYDETLIANTLKNVGFMIEKREKNLVVNAPIWRTDIHIKEDVIEEVGRLLGYDNITPVLPLHLTAERNPVFVLRRRIRELMARYGANEVLTYSFVSGRLLEKVAQDPNNSYKIVNSISPELQYIRQSIIPSLLDKTYMNEKLPVEKFAIYEMNAVYRKESGMDSS